MEYPKGRAVLGSGQGAAIGILQNLLGALAVVKYSQCHALPKALGWEKATLAATLAFVQPPAEGEATAGFM